MRWRVLLALVVAIWLTASLASAVPKKHTVAEGQTLGAIARRYHVSIRELCAANGITRRSVIRPGQELTVPDPSRKSAPSAPSGGVHTVADGQTLGGIAHQYRISVRDLCAANGISESDVLRVGQQLTIPAPGQAPARSSSRAPASTPPASTPPASTPKGPRVHTVAQGQTLGAIARRYHVSISAMCRANGIRRSSPIRPGQRLVVPDNDHEPATTPASLPPTATSAASSGGLQQLSVPGPSPVYYYEPAGPGRLALRPVIFYLHGRGGDPASDCRRWAPIARPLGWLVCPGGPTLHNGGRAWHNSWVSGQHIVMLALRALRSRFGRRVQLYGNTLIGFSEGAHVAMNVGVRNPRTFNRWLILAASDAYWGAKGIEALRKNRNTIRRVYLITGERDGVVERTRVVRSWLRNAHVATRISTPETLAHEIALNRKAGLYRMALIWLNRG